MTRLRLAACALAGITLLAASAPLQVSAADWLNQDWARRVELTVKPEQIAGDQDHEDITLLVHVTADSLGSVFATAKTDGSDLIVTSGDGTTVLPHELVSYDPVEQDSELWFRASTLSATSNVFYLYFGNPDTTVAGADDQAWTEKHLAVYHFDESPDTLSQLADSGPGDGENPASIGAGSTWSSTDLVEGQIGDGWYFDGVDDWLFANSIVSADSSFTVSAWYANVDATLQSMIAFQALSGFWDLSFFRSSNDPNSALRTYQGEMYWEPEILDSSMHHFTWVADAEQDTARFYLDGIEQDVKVYWTIEKAKSFYGGESIDGRVGIAGPVFSSGVDRTQGVVDEYRIKEGVDSPERILTEFRNQSSAETFYSYRQEFYDPVTAADPFRPSTSIGKLSVWPNPFQYSAQIEVETSDPSFAVRVYDLAGRLVRTLDASGSSAGVARLHWDGRDHEGQPVSSGVYYVRVLSSRGSLAQKVLVIR